MKTAKRSKQVVRSSGRGTAALGIARPLIIQIRDSQRVRPVDRRRVREVVETILRESGQTAELGLHFVTADYSARLNGQFLEHEGPTDIITFDYGSTGCRLHGELFICVAEAVRQAREFGTTWETELDRYVVHGLLHLQGFDDREPAARRRMKRAEERWLQKMSAPPSHV
ncbi:MAG TPA: rRNA maturation RNase YbeY [Verrucomicrobiota bacterium]|nr:rRNA maturation RNase YbeY [Verrucomicrobiales bacterium]HRI16346.1 rRNA maturation RNase YbeY [Verrucomicrobiota bacterium]